MALSRTWSLVGEYFVPQRIQLLSRMIDREAGRELLAEFDLSVADWRVLALINSLGNLTAVEICSIFEVDRAEVSRAVARLIKTGLVRREADSANRTKKIILPTDKGRTIFGQAVEKRQAYFSLIMQDLSSEDVSNLDRVLLAIATRVDEIRCAKGMDGVED